MNRSQEYIPPYVVTDKDLSTIYGRYEIYKVDKSRGGFTSAVEAQTWVGEELIVTAALFRFSGARLENPTYRVWFYPHQPEGVVTPHSEWWSSFYDRDWGQAHGDEVIKVYQLGSRNPWFYLEIIGPNEVWVGFDGWYYNARKTVLLPGTDDYCQIMGPRSAGQGDCDRDGECQSGLTCTDDVGANYGFAADIDVCEMR